MNIAGLRVTVVGAGIGGMATAVLLSRAGAAVVVLERVPEITAVGAGLLLQPNGLAVLDGMGLAGPLRAAGFTAAQSTVRRPDGAAISTVRVPDFGPGL